MIYSFYYLEENQPIDMDEIMVPTLSNYLVQCPLFLAWVAGLVLAVMRWKKHPRVSLLVTIALVIILVEAIINTSLGIWLPWMLTQQGMAYTQIGTILAIWGFISSLVNAGIWVLLLVAIFGWRDELPVPPIPEALQAEAALSKPVQ